MAWFTPRLGSWLCDSFDGRLGLAGFALRSGAEGLAMALLVDVGGLGLMAAQTGRIGADLDHAVVARR